MSGTAGKRPGDGGAPRIGAHTIPHYVLSDLLPPGHLLVLNRDLALLSWLAPTWDAEPWPHVLLQEQFTRHEERILFPLLENYPHFCPYEALLACYSTGQITDASLAWYRQHLHEAQLAGTWTQEMRPIRALLSRVRFKLRVFGLDVSSLFETGYLLKQAETKPQPL